MSPDLRAISRLLNKRRTADTQLQAVRLGLPIRQLIAARLLIERTRLQAEQEEVADWLMVDITTYAAYEDGARNLPADQLATLAQLGFDSQFVLTGFRSAEAEQIAAETTWTGTGQEPMRLNGD